MNEKRELGDTDVRLNTCTGPCIFKMALNVCEKYVSCFHDWITNHYKLNTCNVYEILARYKSSQMSTMLSTSTVIPSNPHGNVNL